MTFTVYGDSSPLSKAVYLEFSKLSQTNFVSSHEELLAQNAENIIAVSPFHDDLKHNIRKKILTIELVRELPQSMSSETYYVHEKADANEASKIIVKTFFGFESKKSCGIFPREYIKNTTLPMYEVSKSIEASIEALPQAQEKKATPTPLVSKKSHTRKVNVNKHIVFGFLVFVIWVVSLPFVLLLLSAGCAFLSLRTFSLNDYLLTRPLLRCSSVSSQAVVTLSRVASMSKLQNLASFVQDGVEIALDAHSLTLALQPFTASKLVDSSPQLQKLSRDVSFLASRQLELSYMNKLAPKVFFVLEHGSLMRVMAAVASQANDVFGENSPKTYLVLLQNNMELRPTGGFIGSFMLLDVDNGELTSSKIYDVYDADGQIGGHVAPPNAIRDYLGEASWYLRDSNWDPDFSISAKRAEWFLDKSLNRKIDGVIAVNLEVLRTIITLLGPLQVPDYGGELNSDNFYRTIQTEVHKEFFPGSRKKSNYLTAVFGAVVNKLNEKGNTNLLALLSGLVKNLESRDIQFFSNNESIQSELVKAEIAGDVSANSLGFVEANVGVNKANQYVDREGVWRFEKEGTSIKVDGVLLITNTASTNIDETRYRVYLRTFAPKGSKLNFAKVSVAGQELAIVPEKEMLATREQEGVFFEVKAGERAMVKVQWETPGSDLELWKQGGVLPYPISITSLTEGGERQYNTVFTSDKHIEL